MLKRATQALILTSIVLAGCSGIGDGDSAPDNRLTNSVSSEYVTEIRQNLMGLCVAIPRYGLPADQETRDYVRQEIGQLRMIAEEQPDLRIKSGDTAARSIAELATAYEWCDPEMGAEIRASAESATSPSE